MPNQGAKVFLDVNAPGGPFTLVQFRGTERLSSPFEYTLLMTSTSRTIDFNTLMGQGATVSLKVGSETRTYNGIIGHFEQDDTPFNPLKFQTNYRATLYPRLWLLNFSGQCRIFQNKSALDIIIDVLKDHEISHINHVNSAGTHPLEYCVQYNETDFNFISRLMEREGIFYFFEQNQDSHTLVLADSPTAHSPCPFAATASFHEKAVQDQFMLHVSSCLITQRIVPQSTTLKSYNYLTPQNLLKAPARGQARAGGGDLTTYDQIYTQQSQGDTLSKVALQAKEYPQKMVTGLSTVPFFLPGYKFHLKDHPRDDANLEYVLYEVIHEARLEPKGQGKHIYENTYTAFPATVPFKAPQTTPKPHIYGTQTAKVTGKEGEEIYTEEYGRVKVKFHWDPSPKEDDTTSCWIRVATLWSGQAWGSLFTPRIGQEVVVSFIDGDPDKPLIVGSVYNGDHKPPYLPGDPTKSTLKTHTSKSDGGYNELRFEDKKGAEEVYLRAQKDCNFHIQNNHDIQIVGGNRTITLLAQEEQEETRESDQSNDKLTLQNGNKSLQIDKGNYTITLTDGHILVTCSAGDVNFDVTGNIGFKCTGNFSINAGENFSVTAGTDISENAGTDISANAGGAITIEAGADISENAGGAITLEAGADVSANAGGAITLEAGADASMAAGGAAEVTAGADVAITAGGAAEVTAGADVAVTAGADVAVTAGGATEVTAGADVAVTAGLALEVTAGIDVSVTAGASLTLTAAGSIAETAVAIEINGILEVDGL